MAALFLSLCLLLAAESYGQNCGMLNQQARIISGSPALPCAVPWHVQVHFVPDNTDYTLSASTMKCSATIIDRNYVMGSPTCFFLYATNISRILSTMVLTAGDNDINVFPETGFLADSTEQHEQYRVPQEIYFQDEYTFRSQQAVVNSIDPFANDYKAWRDNQCAIIKVSQPFTFNECVNNICLPEPGETNCVHKNCIFSGNGLITRDRTSPITRSNRLQVAALTSLPLSTCGYLVDMGYGLPTAGGVCAKTESTGVPCVDDNGGALACIRNGAYFLLGTSVPDYCDGKAASMFSDASQCLGFITNTLAGNGVAAIDA